LTCHWMNTMSWISEKIDLWFVLISINQINLTRQVLIEDERIDSHWEAKKFPIDTQTWTHHSSLLIMEMLLVIVVQY
jgi:hypothetical protein